MITDEMKQLAEVRVGVEVLKDKVRDLQQSLEETLAFQQLEAAKTMLKSSMGLVEDMEAVIRRSVLSSFDGENTKPIDGIQIKRFEVVTLIDEKAAKSWAAQNAPSVLTINRTKFDSVVKALELPFVEVEIEYRAQIASDLSQYLE